MQAVPVEPLIAELRAGGGPELAALREAVDGLLPAAVPPAIEGSGEVRGVREADLNR